VYASSLNVLLVEDSQLLADRLRESILMVPGIDLVATVDSEAAALRALNARPIDVVVVDLHLQGGTGFGVLRALGADQGRRGIVPIVLTNHDLGEYRRAAMALGARHFLDKLRDFDLLPQLLEQIALEPSRPCGRSAVS
jgi:DNA-binding NarL/FixJ family response regulator